MSIDYAKNSKKKCLNVVTTIWLPPLFHVINLIYIAIVPIFQHSFSQVNRKSTQKE